MKKLTDRHLQKLVVVTELPLEKVVELNDMGILNSERVIELLIKFDWKLLMKRNNNLLARQRIKAIAKEYNVSDYYVKKCVYTHQQLNHFCQHCGNEITKLEYSRNGGLCEKCAVESIKI